MKLADSLITDINRVVLAVIAIFALSFSACNGVSSLAPGSNGSTGAGAGGGTGGGTNTSACSVMSTGQGASLNGFRPFPVDNAWNQDISTAPVDANSAAIINFIGPAIGLHAGFGSGQFQGSNIGIPYFVTASQAPVAYLTPANLLS
jgi:hypothetical protein